MRSIPVPMLIVSAALILGPTACGDPGPTVTDVSVSRGKGGGGNAGDPKVTSATPDTASQGTTLDVEIGGSGFDEGSTVQFAIDEVPSEKITVHSTRFLGSKKLRSNITIADDADPVLYDIVVETARGRPGIGTELFEVKRTGDPKMPLMTATFRDAAGDGLVSDGLGSYTDGVDESVIEITESGQLVIDPSIRQKNWPRALCMRFTEEQDRTGAGIPEETLNNQTPGGICDEAGFTIPYTTKEGGLMGMTHVGEVIRGEGKMFPGDKDDNTEFRVGWRCPDDRESPACANLLRIELIERTATRRAWLVSFDPAQDATLVSHKIKGRPGPWMDRGLWAMPFRLTLTREEP